MFSRSTWLSSQGLHSKINGLDMGMLSVDDLTQEVGVYTRPLFSSTSAVLVKPLLVPLSNRPGENHPPNVYHKMCLH